MFPQSGTAARDLGARVREVGSDLRGGGPSGE